MLVQQVVFEANNVNLRLDEYEATGKRGDRAAILQEALLASMRGIQVLSDEPFTRDPASYLTDVEKRLGDDAFRLAEELRQDAAILRMFLAAEARLLADLGVDVTVIHRIRLDLAAALTGDLAAPEATADRLTKLLELLRADLDRLAGDVRDDDVRRRLAGVVQVLGAGIVIAGNGIVGAAAAPVTAGLSAAGAAVSIAAGSVALDHGVTRALSD